MLNALLTPEHVMRFLFSANKRRLKFNRSTEDFESEKSRIVSRAQGFLTLALAIT